MYYIYLPFTLTSTEKIKFDIHQILLQIDIVKNQKTEKMTCVKSHENIS